MNRVLTASSLFAASLALIPTNSQAQSDVKYMNVMDASAVHEKIANIIGLTEDYEGPVVVVQTERHEELEDGYVAVMRFTETSLGPIAEHPMLELIDGDELEGAPMFLTDRISQFRLIEEVSIPMNPTEVAGVIDLQWAADDVFDQLNDGIGEGDFLVVTHGPATFIEADGLPTQEVYAANVVDPQGADSMAIQRSAGVPFAEKAAVVLIYDEAGDIAMGFEEKGTKAIWIANGPDAADREDAASGNGNDSAEQNADDEDREGQQSEDLTDDRSVDLPSNLGGSMDLPEFTPSPRGPVRDNATFAPATHRPVYRR